MFKVFATNGDKNRINSIFNERPPVQFVNRPRDAKVCIHRTRGYDMGDKHHLRIIRDKHFIPPTLFSGELVPKKPEGSEYYLKAVDEGCGSGIRVLLPKKLPGRVPEGYVLQRGIISTLYENHKFDLRVLCCVRRKSITPRNMEQNMAQVMIYRDILYRVNPHKICLDKPRRRDRLTNTSLHYSNPSFWHRRFPERNPFYEHYFKQIVDILPQVYASLLPPANSLFSPHLDQAGKCLEQCFLINGVDFIPDERQKLYFIELNTRPRWNIKGQKEYQLFYKEAFRFMAGEPVDENVATIVNFKIYLGI